ncbi:MAG: cytochrome ubiquinol oxidase subunit I, partial [Pseudomonadota bacterium]
GEVWHPPVAPVFWSFRIMVGTGFAMLALSWLTAFLIWRRPETAVTNPWLHRGFVAMAFSGWVATLAGWYTTEIGRQPWLVQGVMTTEMAVADVPAPMVLSTLILYLSVYAVLLFAYVTMLFVLSRRAAKGVSGPERAHSGAAPVSLVPGE